MSMCIIVLVGDGVCVRERECVCWCVCERESACVGVCMMGGGSEREIMASIY